MKLSGAANDPADSGTAGSGISTVAALLQSVNLNQDGNDWQAATLQNSGQSGVWALDYRFPPGLPDVSGYYTLTVQATDGAGNLGVTTQRLYLDGKGPEAELDGAEAGRDLINTSALRLSGVVSDVTAVGKVDVAVSSEAYQDNFQQTAVQNSIRKHDLKLVVVDIDEEQVILWIN